MQENGNFASVQKCFHFLTHEHIFKWRTPENWNEACLVAVKTALNLSEECLKKSFINYSENVISNLVISFCIHYFFSHGFLAFTTYPFCLLLEGNNQIFVS